MKRKLGELLIEAGAATADDVDAALSDQSAGEPSRLGDLLLSTGKITPAALARALAVQHDLPFADLSYVAPEASDLIPLEFQRAHKLVPFRLDKDGGATRVHVALADPTLVDVVEELRSQLKREVIVHVAPIDDIENVHAALAGEGTGEPVVMGEVLEEEVFMPPAADPAGEISFPEPAPEEFALFADAPGGFSGGDSSFAEGRAWGQGFPEEAPAAPVVEAAAPASVTEEELFGSLDLGAPAEVAPLSTDLADEIGRHDLAPPSQDFAGFSALSQPLGDPEADRFGARSSAPVPVPDEPMPLAPERPLTEPDPAPSELELLLDAEVEPEPMLDLPQIVPAPLISPMLDTGPDTHESTQKFAGQLPGNAPPRIPSFAIPPDVPVEPRRSPIEPLKRPATLGRIALKRVAVSRSGEAVAAPAAVIIPPPPPAAPDLELPEWMRSGSEPAPALPVLAIPQAGELSAQLVELLNRVESGAVSAGPALAALMRLLVERRVIDDATLRAALEQL